MWKCLLTSFEAIWWTSNGRDDHTISMLPNAFGDGGDCSLVLLIKRVIRMS